MIEPLHAYVFREPAFSPAGDTVVCVVDGALLTRYLSLAEVEEAFSGYALYRGQRLHSFVGVWGQRNAKRFRRFLRERGAELVITDAKPENVRLSRWVTRPIRTRVRRVDAINHVVTKTRVT